MSVTIGTAANPPATTPPANTALTITSPSTLPSGVVSTFYSAPLTATGGTSPYTWSIKGCAGACNTGLGFSNSGLLSGTPINAGTSTFTFAVTDSKGQTASAPMNIAIGAATAPPATTAPPTSPLSITSSSTLPNGSVSAAYSASLSATGGTTPYAWTIRSCSGVCDAGLSLSQAGAFSGTPTQSGATTYNVVVSDANGQTASASLNLTVAAAAAPNPSGANYYVSPSGSNSGSCTQSSPCATPDYAFNRASPGETVQVAAGTYDYGSSAAQFTKSGSAGKYITVTCATRGACKIQNSVTGNSTVVVLGGSYITFDGFEVTNTSSAGNNLGLYVTTSYVNITRNTIHGIQTDCGSNGGGGIQIAGSGSSNSDLNHITIDSNLIYDINYRNGSPKCTSSTVQSDGILVETAGTANVVTNNIVHHTSGGWGILVGNSNATNNNVNSLISNNTVFSTTGGIIVMSGNGTTISNNIVANTGQQTSRCGITAPPGVSITYLNNDLWNNAGGNYCLQWGTSNQSVHSNDISLDPALGTTFVNWQADGSGDYHLKPGSPAIDAGNSTVGPPPTADFDGNPRPKGARHDIGAYEYQN
ncbi:MAG: hypothetical protein JSS95_17645 [Acidobacteria bacterium]|nr:hypothetical protein [Acidobacteriota bacterium]